MLINSDLTFYLLICLKGCLSLYLMKKEYNEIDKNNKEDQNRRAIYTQNGIVTYKSNLHKKMFLKHPF